MLSSLNAFSPEKHTSYKSINALVLHTSSVCLFNYLLLYRGRRYSWLEILLQIGKNQLRQSTRVDPDMRLKLDLHKGSKCYSFHH